MDSLFDSINYFKYFSTNCFFVARLIGVISTANIVFAAIIFMLIILVYVLFNKVSMLEEKQKT